MILRSIKNLIKLNSNCKVRFCTTRTMADVDQYPGIKLNDILTRLQTFAPLQLAEPWDNVGLLVDPISDVPIKNILLTNDLTQEVLDEAIQLKTGLIVSYHPNIFQRLKTVTAKSWKERIVVKCIKNNIAVFSPHTSWDACQNGVNDWLAASLPIISSTPIKESTYDAVYGAGRFCELSEPITLQNAVQKIKEYVGLQHLNLAVAKGLNQQSKIAKIAVCAGSGSSVLNGSKADLYITGEMSHHDVLDAVQKGIHVVLLNHSNSERGFLRGFQDKLEKNILEGKVEVVVSKVDKDPLEMV